MLLTWDRDHRERHPWEEQALEYARAWLAPGHVVWVLGTAGSQINVRSSPSDVEGAVRANLKMGAVRANLEMGFGFDYSIANFQ